MLMDVSKTANSTCVANAILPVATNHTRLVVLFCRWSIIFALSRHFRFDFGLWRTTKFLVKLPMQSLVFFTAIMNL